MIDSLKNVIDSVIRGVIAFNDVKIISPLQQKKGA
jgi:LysR family hydrogen peroxide-inducible transcriptional activator